MSGAQGSEILCGVEDGWWGCRELSLAAAREGRRVTVLIRDRLEPDVLAMIATPPGMRVASIPRAWFHLRLLGAALAAGLAGALGAVVVTKPRTARRLAPVAALFRAPVYQVIETMDGYRCEGTVPEAARPALFCGTIRPAWLSPA